MKSEPKRKLIVADALSWLEALTPMSDTALIASMPDFSEFPSHSLIEWKNWFQNTAELILRKTADDQLTLFFQTDIKHEGEWVDKSFLCQKAAENKGRTLLAHKIFCRIKPDVATTGRPTYSHLLIFSKDLKFKGGHASADVISTLGEKIWERGMGVEACLFALKLVQKESTAHTIINPFCGQGSVLAAANALGLHAIGIELSRKRVRKAELLELSLEAKRWSSKISPSSP